MIFILICKYHGPCDTVKCLKNKIYRLSACFCEVSPVLSSFYTHSCSEYLNFMFLCECFNFASQMMTQFHMLYILQAQIYAASLFTAVVFDWNLYASVVFILIITVLYTVVGNASINFCDITFMYLISNVFFSDSFSFY